jgi:transposase
VCALMRGRSNDDDRVSPGTLSWDGGRRCFTQESEAFAPTLMKEMRVKPARQILCESDSRIYRLHFVHVKGADARLSFDNVVSVSSAEYRWRTGHKYLTVFANLVGKIGIFETPGRNASVWESFAAELLPQNGHQKVIQYVAIDMSAAYIKGED